MKTILLTITNQKWIHKKVIERIFLLSKQSKEYNIIIYTPSFTPYENNLNKIVDHFIQKNYDFWINIDSDNPPNKKILDLIKLDKDIIGLPTPVWQYNLNILETIQHPIYLNAYKYIKEKDSYQEYFPQQGLQEVDAIGSGCFIINKRVFQNEKMKNAPFSRKFNEKGIEIIGVDLSFCKKAKENGFTIWCHFDYLCSHYKEINLLDILYCLNKQEKKYKNIKEINLLDILYCLNKEENDEENDEEKKDNNFSKHNEIFCDLSKNVYYDKSIPININNEEKEIENIEVEEHFFFEDKLILKTTDGCKYQTSYPNSGENVEEDEWEQIC